jgi:hypothetical protein
LWKKKNSDGVAVFGVETGLGRASLIHFSGPIARAWLLPTPSPPLMPDLLVGRTFILF